MPKKIFELAKDLDIGALDLVEKLKDNGFSVRNHMSSLSDEEVEKAIALCKPAEPVKKTKKKTKKKTAKKKVTKKKVVKKASSSKASDEGSQEKVEAKEAAAPEKVADEPVVEEKKKTVVTRKKKTVEKLKEEALAAKEGNSLHNQDLEEMKGSFGLKVVAAAPKPEEKEEKTEAKKTDNKDDSPEGKPHRFTPVYVPEPKAASSDSEEDDDKKDKSKKRLGGLASLMGGKKTAISRSQALVQDRADSELKSYAALSSLGKPVYSNVKRKKVYTGATKQTEVTEVKDSKRVIKLHGGGTAAEVAKKLKVKFKELADKALDINLLMKSDDYIGIGLAEKLAALYNYRVEDVKFNEDEVIGLEEIEDKSHLPLRNPIITIMGHVDHGKTTLLDYIREAKVASGEAGGITQHIGAYSVKVKDQTLTFLDTPGHAAFAAMRQRGADVTDIVILVVAADDGVMPQTRESIKFCQNSDKPLIVAINKMDKEGVNPDRVKNELTEFNITPEEWGGDTQFVPVSALKGDGVDELLESLALQAEMLELREDPKGVPEGVVIESKIEQGRGPVATVLVQKGTLKKGDSIVVGETYGRARSLTDSFGKELKNAGPSTPVQILGLADAPSPGDILNSVKNEREAKKIAANRVDERKKLALSSKTNKMSLEDFFATAVEEGKEQKSLNLIIRSDVQGSYEAIKSSLEPLSTSEVDVKIIGGGVGPISDSDISLAESSNAFVIGFNMRPVTSARKLSDEKGIDIKTYSIIYELINDIKLAVEGLLDPEYSEKFIGRAEVKDTFSVPKAGVIAGSLVVDGKISVGCNVRLLRAGKIMHDGKMSSLKRFKDDAKEVNNGLECGIGLENYNDIKVGDIFECYILEERKRSFEDVVKMEQEAEAAAAAAAAKAAEEMSDSL